jgi:hypothetical protein
MKKLIASVLLFLGCGQQPTASYYSPSQNCTVATVNSVTTVSCPDGTQSNIDQENFVQFCSGTTMYPTEFNEVGICYLGNLYGVYSLNNGFLTLIPPGEYESNAVGSSCNFQVLPNCVIVDN